MAKVGGLRRCGLCALAAKRVDHLPAISAKKNELHERIRSIAVRLSRVEAQGPLRLAERLHGEMELDAKELMGWELSEQLLMARLREMQAGEGEPTAYHADQPDLVKLHLRQVVRNQKECAFFLRTISDASAYPEILTVYGGPKNDWHVAFADAAMVLRELMDRLNEDGEVVRLDHSKKSLIDLAAAPSRKVVCDGVRQEKLCEFYSRLDAQVQPPVNPSKNH